MKTAKTPIVTSALARGVDSPETVSQSARAFAAGMFDPRASTAAFPGCGCCPLSRRSFLKKGAAACATALALSVRPVEAAESPAGRLRIRIVYVLFGPKQPRPTWPNIGFDFGPVMQRLEAGLARECPGFEFVTAMASTEAEAKKILEEDQGSSVAGYLVYQMNNWPRVVQTIAASGKPVLYADFTYAGTGGFLTYNAALLRARSPNVGFVSSSELADLIEAVKCFELVRQGRTPSEFVAATARLRQRRTPPAASAGWAEDPVRCLSISECVGRMKASKVLAIRDQNSAPTTEIMGIPIVYVPFAELNGLAQAADPDEVRLWADRWERGARRIEGVTRETIEQSAAMYLGQKALLQKHSANAITINCLGGFYGKHINAYPCLGFCQLVDDGLVGACECDIRSAATMVAITTLTRGRPGYISDPVMDSAKREIIYAHCVAPTRVFGPSGGANPYEILTHSEDRQGASLRSLMPVGHLTTTLEFEPKRKEIMFHQAKAVGNDANDRACRTKLRAQPLGDFEKLFAMWDVWGWHRVTFYGDLKEPVYALADAVGWKVVTET
ncbi:MAG TPA: twin-arginine translocation signal domain-containing protein [Verrucomicrobiota bacterium]|nr:twin-arginine translocation signal domain-containing protein [Verrucomicrobiota bacterium]